MILEGLLYHLTRDLPRHTREVAERIAERRSNDFTDSGWYVTVRHPVNPDAWYVKHYNDRLEHEGNL
jgi:hypothetical protein